MKLKLWAQILLGALLLRLSEAKVKLKKNSYRGLVIAINPEVEEDPAIVSSLKAAWTDASRDLFRATKKRIYYKTITILVPKTWTNGSYNPSNGENYKKAEVVVADQNPMYGDNPYTVQYGKCGEKASYIHLTPGYLTNDQATTNYGPRGKTLVHEWAHYRWGVYDEIVTNGYDSFYMSSSGEIEANRCPLTVKGDNYYVDWSAGFYRACNIEPQTMLPEDGCVFFPDESKSAGASASMMSYQYLDSVYTFCHDDADDPRNQHNKAAPNEHNRLCNLRSTWDVITSSEDFTGNQTMPSNDIEDTTPVFNVVRPASYQRFVLVLDTSGSMDGDRLLMMRQAASTFILQAAPTGSDIGMVEFSSTASTLSKLIRIDSYKDRQALNDKLPEAANGGTSIGSGIREALEVLQRSCGSDQTGYQCTSGGILIVLSDGQENEAPTLSEVYQEIIDAGVIVHSMVFTAAADPMLQVIADDTGGNWYFSDENGNNATSALTDAFVTVARVDDGDSYRENFQIYSSSFAVDKYATHAGNIVIDMTIGNNTVFTFAWSQYVTPGVVLEAPDGCTYSTSTPPTPCEPGTKPLIDNNLKTITFAISGTAQVGSWKYYVSSSSAYSQNVVVTVTSMASDRDVQPILVESGMSNISTSDGEAVVIYAQVSMGYAPVLNADVTATIERPTGGPVTVVLKDKGAAPDVRKNDGIYSRYFTKYNGPGRYSVQVSVTGLDGQTTSAYDASGSKAAYKAGSFDSSGNLNLNLNNIPVAPPQTATGNFSRYTSAGGFSFSGSSSSDTFPPSQILDLTASQRNLTEYNSGIWIMFTAPGDDFDAGTATYYDIRYTYGDLLSLTTNFSSNGKFEAVDVAGGCLTNPQTAGSAESYLVRLPDLPHDVPEQSVAVAITAVDDVGNVGQVSNVVTVNYFIEPLNLESKQETAKDTAFILMIVFVCTTAILLVAVGFLLWSVRSQKRKLKPTDSGVHRRSGVTA